MAHKRRKVLHSSPVIPVYAKSNGLQVDLNAWFGLTQTTESMVWFVQTTANGLSNGLQSV